MWLFEKIRTNGDYHLIISLLLDFRILKHLFISLTQRKIKNGITRTTSLLKYQASLNSKCIKCITARVIPQPKHSRLKQIFDKQSSLVEWSKRSAGKNNKINGLTKSKPI